MCLGSVAADPTPMPLLLLPVAGMSSHPFSAQTPLLLLSPTGSYSYLPENGFYMVSTSFPCTENYVYFVFGQWSLARMSVSHFRRGWLSEFPGMSLGKGDLIMWKSVIYRKSVQKGWKHEQLAAVGLSFSSSALPLWILSLLCCKDHQNGITSDLVAAQYSC